MDTSYSTTKLDKSFLFSAYNYARHSKLFDEGRLNRALGYVQAGRVVLLPNGVAIAQGDGDIYWINSEGCDCPDATWRGTVCKHQLARFILIKMRVLERARGPEPTPEPPVRSTCATHTPPAPPLESIKQDVAALWGAA